jgi:hypothetical protein
MTSKEDNKCKYAADGAEEEAEPKKWKTINSDDNGDDLSDDDNDNNDDNDDSSSSADDDFGGGNEHPDRLQRGDFDPTMGTPLMMNKSPVATSLMTNFIVVLVNSYCVRLVLVLVL